MIECSVFVYKHTFCSKGELIIGNNGYEIIYEPKHSKSRNTRINIDTNDNDISYTTPSPSLSSNSSNFLLSFIGHLSPTMVVNNTDILHRIIIDWETISGLQRKNKNIKYNEKNDIKLYQQLIIESKSYPTLHIMEYNNETMKYETKSVQSLHTHYIGLEYDIMHSHDVLLGNNYHKRNIYPFVSAFDIDNHDASSLLQKYPLYSKLINHALPSWVWIPLLNHTLRVFIERMILIGNVALFIWTIYQMTKYTSIIRGFYEHIFYPLFDYISKPIIKKIYYFVNLMYFDVVLLMFSNIFNLIYNYIPINLLYRLIAFLDQNILQQVISLFTMIYRLFSNTFSIFSPLLNSITFTLKQCLSFIDWNWIKLQCDCIDCMFCNRLSVIWTCIRRCCVLCPGTQTLRDSTKILKAGVKAMNAAEESVQVNNISSIWSVIDYTLNYIRSVIDVFWIGIGKPIKHSYDFCRYIQSEVGVVVGVCIRKICGKSKAKIKNVGKKVLEEAKNSIIKNTPKTKESDREIESIDSIQHHNVLRFRGNKARNEEENDEKTYSAVYGIQYYKNKHRKATEKQ